MMMTSDDQRRKLGNCDGYSTRLEAPHGRCTIVFVVRSGAASRKDTSDRAGLRARKDYLFCFIIGFTAYTAMKRVADLARSPASSTVICHHANQHTVEAKLSTLRDSIIRLHVNVDLGGGFKTIPEHGKSRV